MFGLGISILFFLVFVTPIGSYAAEPTCPVGMEFIRGGTFTIGADSHDFLEEKSAPGVSVDSFCIDRYEVTNAQFSQFVDETGYITIAERPLSKEQFPNLSDNERLAGSLVFEPPEDGQQPIAYLSWWHWRPGANWRHPYGPDSNLEGKTNHPVVHVAFDDALAYAAWAGKQLPSEAQWEYAARGGKEGQTFTWGEAYSAQKANTWQGLFPLFNSEADGYLGTAPVGSFPPNGYSLYDMTGNVWEWTSDWFALGHADKSNKANPVGPTRNRSFDPKKPGEGAVHVIKGGSHLCAKNYCSRYRPAARESQSPDTGTTHIGFRLVKPLRSQNG